MTFRAISRVCPRGSKAATAALSFHPPSSILYSLLVPTSTFCVLISALRFPLLPVAPHSYPRKSSQEEKICTSGGFGEFVGLACGHQAGDELPAFVADEVAMGVREFVDQAVGAEHPQLAADLCRASAFFLLVMGW